MYKTDYPRLEDLIKKTGKTKTYLCRCLGRSAYYLRDAKKTGRALDYEEINILARELDCCPEYLQGLSDRAERKPEQNFLRREIDDIYDGLSAEGQKALTDYGSYLLTKDEMRAPEKTARVDYIRHYLTAAAAGYAAPIEGEDYDLIERDAETPPRADFCIDISGDSMEPYIHDGQRVYVQRDQSLCDMDVGIFFVDGDVYCKQFCLDYTGTVRLLSANPEREDANIYIPRGSGRNLVCFGKVILKHRLPMPVYI